MGDRFHCAAPAIQFMGAFEREIQAAMVAKRLHNHVLAHGHLGEKPRTPPTQSFPSLRQHILRASQKPVKMMQAIGGGVAKDCGLQGVHWSARYGVEDIIISTPMTHFTKIIVASLLATPTLIGCSSAPPIESTTNSAQHYIDFDQCQQAADLIRPVVDQWPGEWKAQFILGRAELCLGNLPEARHALEAANSRKPDNMDVVFALADCMQKQKDIPELYLLLRNAGAEFRSAEAYVKLAEIADSTGDMDSEKTALLAAIELDEGYGMKRIISPYLQMSQLQEKLGDQADALRRLRQAYGVNPNDPRVQSALLARGQVLGPTLALPGGI